MFRKAHIATSTLCDKSEEMCVGSRTRNRIVKADCDYDFVNTSGKDRKDKESMHKIELSLLNLTKPVGTLSSTIQAVLQACLQFRFLHL